MTVAEVNTVYKATTTKAIQDRGRWPRRLILISAVLLVILGTVIIALSTLICGAAAAAGDSENSPNLDKSNNSNINSTDVVEIGKDESEKEDDDDDDGIEWRIFATGVVFLAAGLIIFILYFVCSDDGCSGGGRKRNSNALLPKPKLRSGAAGMDAEEFAAEDGSAVVPTSEEKAELMSHELKQERNKLDEVKKRMEEAEIPAHYKRHFNQHGYGSKVMAPLATMDEFDHSLRSSMNSLWSQHLHRQEVDSLYGEDNDESELDNEDAMSFQSALVN